MHGMFVGHVGDELSERAGGNEVTTRASPYEAPIT